MDIRAPFVEELKRIDSQKLQKRAARYRTVVVPEITMSLPYGLDENWERGHAIGLWYLKPAAIASIYRQIAEAKRLRREAWESWVKILGTVLPWMIALASVLVSLTLAGRLGGPPKPN